MTDEYYKSLIKDWYERITNDVKFLASRLIPETSKVLEEMKVHIDESE